MCLLWAYKHDFAAISPFLSERILCRHPFRSLWLKQKRAGCRSERSEGHSKSVSPRYVPTNLLLLKQRTSRPVPAFHSVRHPRIGCRSQHRGMCLRPLRIKVQQGWPLGCCHHRRTGPRADGHACPGSREVPGGA